MSTRKQHQITQEVPIHAEPPYQEYTLEVVKLLDQDLQNVTKPGSLGGKEPFHAEILLAEHLELSTDSKVLVLGSPASVFYVFLAKQTNPSNLWICNLDHLSLECARRSLMYNGYGSLNRIDSVDIKQEQLGFFDVILMFLPKGRKLSRRWLVQAYHLLKPGSSLYLVGSKSEGIESISSDAEELFSARAIVLDYKKGYRIILVTKSRPSKLPEWSQQAGIAPGTWFTFDIHLSGQKINIYSLPGVFSYNRLDEGSEFLLENLKVQQAERILDIGCGYGILGLVALELGGKGSSVHLVDSNLLAVASASETFNHHFSGKNLDWKISVGDLTENLNRNHYSLVVTNPPFHTGQQVNYSTAQALIQQAYQVLMTSGRLVLVANKFIRYEKILAELFPKVETIAQNNRYHLLQAYKG